MDDYSDKEILDALDAAGVDNWEGYGYAMDRLEEFDGDRLAALRAAGVDNWGGYGYAMDILEEND